MANGLITSSKTARSIRTNKVKQEFVAALSRDANVTGACQASGIARRTAYEWRDADEAFRKAWDDAIEAAVDRAESEAWRRAVDGVEKAVFYQGERVDKGEVREWSDKLLEMILIGRRREIYGNKQELTGANGGPVRVAVLQFQADV